MTPDIGDRIKLEKEKDSRLHSLDQQVTQLSNAYSTFADMVDPKQIVDAIRQKKFKHVPPEEVGILLKKFDKGKEIRDNLMFVPKSN